MGDDNPYNLDQNGVEILPDFTGWDEEALKDWVEEWFYDHYCDPVHEMPYIDGEYHYIWGGPYDAREQIEDWFSDVLSEDLITEIVDRVESDGTMEWAPGNAHADQRARAEEYWVEQYDEWLQSEEPLAIFTNSALALREFIKKETDQGKDSFVHRMMFMQAWAMLEALLADQLIEVVAQDPKLIARLYQGDKHLQKEKFTGDTLLKNPDLPKSTALDFLRGIPYHNLPRAETIYGICFGNQKDAEADTKPFLKELGKLQTVRHDCVHRNGRTKVGALVPVSTEDVVKVLESGEAFAKELGKMIAHYKNESGVPDLDSDVMF